MLIVVGSTDMSKRFHLIGFTVTSNETALDYEFTFRSILLGVHKITGQQFKPSVLMSNADPAIHNGFKNAGFDPEIQS